MGLQDDVFGAFVRANELQRVPEFSKAGRDDPLYVKDEVPARRSEIERTIGFAGFVDGYQGREERFRGPRGSLEAARTGGVDGILDRLAEFSPDGEEIARGYREMVGDPSEAYAKQYRRGLAASKL